MQNRQPGAKANFAATVVLGVLLGCGQGGSAGQLAGGGGSPATGGVLAAGGSGGRAGSGGNSASGGTTGVGGSNATGGSTTQGSTGGSSATGGRPVTGGSGAGAATDGQTAGGGSSSTGGGPGSGGTTTSPTGGSTVQGGTGGGGTGGLSGSGGASSRDGGAGDTGQGRDGGVDLLRLPEAGTETGDVGPSPDAAAYRPCPGNGDPCKILPLGDSITFGVGDEGNGGYRGPLFGLVVAAQQKVTFTGSLSNGPSTVSGQTFPKKNEGHSGWGISQVTPYSGGNAGIATVIPNPAFSSGSGGTPHIILLHIGTNDQGSLSAAQMTSDIEGLLEKLITNAPDALLVVAQIIPLGYGTNDVIKTYNQAIPGLVQERAAAGKHIILVDMYTGFTTSTMLASDNIHPNSTGYKRMADRWYAAIGSLLPK